MSNEPISSPADRPWSGPLGGPYLTAAQRERLADDIVLAVAALLDPADASLQARVPREAAGDILDHREADQDRRGVAATGGSRRGTANDRGQLSARELLRANRLWHSLTGQPPDDLRAARVAVDVTQRAYTAVYPIAYTTTASRIAAAATDAAVANPPAWITLQPLAMAAGDAIGRLNRHAAQAPPVDPSTIETAKAAARSDTREPWHAVAQSAWENGTTAGTRAATSTATADVLAGWRARGGEKHGVHAVIEGQPAYRWIAGLVAAVNRQTGDALPAASARHLASQDQAAGVAARPVNPSSHRTRPTGSQRSATTQAGRTR